VWGGMGVMMGNKFFKALIKLSLTIYGCRHTYRCHAFCGVKVTILYDHITVLKNMVITNFISQLGLGMFLDLKLPNLEVVLVKHLLAQNNNGTHD
jgi:hypothetical protein